MATIEIKEYPVFFRLGWYSEERKFPQKVLLTITLDVAQAPYQGLEGQESLDGTVDYAAVLMELEQLLADREIKLLETVVTILGHGILDRFPQCTKVRVKVEKLRIPAGVNRGARIQVSDTFSRERCDP